MTAGERYREKEDGKNLYDFRFCRLFCRKKERHPTWPSLNSIFCVDSQKNAEFCQPVGFFISSNFFTIRFPHTCEIKKQEFTMQSLIFKGFHLFYKNVYFTEILQILNEEKKI